MTPLDFIASLDGEAKAAALTVYNLMTPRWVKITDDPATLPPLREVVVIRAKSNEFLGARVPENRSPNWCWVATSGNSGGEWDKELQKVLASDGWPNMPQPTHWRAIG